MNNLFYQFDRLIGRIVVGMNEVARLLQNKIGEAMPEKLFSKHITQSEFLHIYKRLSMLLLAGIPLGQAVLILCDQAPVRRQKDYLAVLHDSIMSGRSLSAFFAVQVKVPMSFQTLIALGEQTGTLATQMGLAVDELWRVKRFWQRLFASLLYPAILFVVTIGILVFLLLVVFPKITPIFNTFNIELPLSTRIIIATSDWLNHYGLLVVGVMIGISVLSWFVIQKRPVLRLVLARVVLSLPVWGKVVRWSNIVQSSRLLSLLLQSGVRSSEAVLVIAEHTYHPLYRSAFTKTAHQLHEGQKMSRSLASHPSLFTADAIGLIAVAEDSGTLPNTLQLISELYEQDLEAYLKRLTILIEPLLMVVMGLSIGFIAVSIITPLYGLTNGMSV
jgi:type IV pilus assembly protein PilC